MAILKQMKAKGKNLTIIVFPGADHGLFTADPDPSVARTEQLAPGFLSMVAAFLRNGSKSPVRPIPSVVSPA